jgi:isopentenyl-diphosphate delta-isomerase
MNQVILVNELDQDLGVIDKLPAHEKGLLHRAFSIFAFNSKGQVLLQQRMARKYHSGGLWTNTCCGHQAPGEELLDSANRRLMEEMGMSCSLNHLFSFHYKAILDHQLIEHEIDHVFFTISDQVPQLNPEEADDYRYESPAIVLKEMAENPDKYTEWFKISFGRVLDTVFGSKNPVLELKAI